MRLRSSRGGNHVLELPEGVREVKAHQGVLVSPEVLADGPVVRVDLGDVGPGRGAAAFHAASPGTPARDPTAIAANCEAVNSASQTTALSMKP